MEVKLGISNRHVHLTKEDYEVLFGNEMPINIKDLVQPGEYATDKKVTIKTEKSSIDNVRVLGPFRSYSQVEISKTDSYQLGVTPPVRSSGDLDGASIITIVGPNGEITKPCAIIAVRHLHISPAEIKKYKLEGIERVSVKIKSEKETIFSDVLIKANESYVLELHLDTDDANGALAKNGEEVEIIS